jgi:hypothetical protein
MELIHFNQKPLTFDRIWNIYFFHYKESREGIFFYYVENLIWINVKEGYLTIEKDSIYRSY